MKEDSAIGPGLSNPVYPDLTRHLVTTTAVPDPKTRFVLAVCSAHAYGDVTTVASIMDRLGLERNRCRMISEYVDALFLTSTAFLIQSHDGQVAILCYRGTPPTSAITWLTNFAIEPVTIELPTRPGTKKAEVHGGFYRNVRSTRFKIVELLQRAFAKESILDSAEHPEDVPPTECLKALYVTGHSLGGASAALFAALLAAEPLRYGASAPGASEQTLETIRAVYTYGAPMIGNPTFADACHNNPAVGGKVVRFVHANDLVPQVPPAASGAFKHFGEEYRYRPQRKNIGSQDDLWARSDPPIDQIGSLIALAAAPLSVVAKSIKIVRRVPFPASLSDHFPQYYLDRLTPADLRSEFGN